MTTATKAPKSKKPRKPQSRAASLMQLGERLILWLTVDGDAQSYGLARLASDRGTAFHLHKADRGDGHSEEYDVLIDGAGSSCECKGFLRWGHCKHLESLAALIAAGKLPAAAGVEPAGVPAALPACNDFDDP